MLLYSMLSTLCLSFETLLSKVLATRGANGKLIGFQFLFAEGLLGTVILAIFTLSGGGLYSLSRQSFTLMMIGGLTGVIAINLLQYSVVIGVAGVALSLFNTNAAFFAGLCYFLLG